MEWKQAQWVAHKILEELSRDHRPEEVRLILRAMQRGYHKGKNMMKQPTIIVSSKGPDSFQVDVSGRFGGGFRGVTKDRQGILGMLSLLKSYDCGEEPAVVVVPTELEPEFRKVFPKSF